MDELILVKPKKEHNLKSWDNELEKKIQKKIKKRKKKK